MKKLRFTEICGCFGGPGVMILQAKHSPPLIYIVRSKLRL